MNVEGYTEDKGEDPVSSLQEVGVTLLGSPRKRLEPCQQQAGPASQARCPEVCRGLPLHGGHEACTG